MSRSGVGCYVSTHFTGALKYADYIVLSAPTATALRKLLGICGHYATELTTYAYHSMLLKRSVSWLYQKNRRDVPTGLMGFVFFIHNSPIEFVDSFMHFGHMFTPQLDDGLDVANRHAAFIGQINNMLCFFGKTLSYVKFKLFCSYCTSFYGCAQYGR